MTRRGFTAGFSMMGAAFALRAQETETPAMKRGRDLASRVIQALGGDGFRFMRSRVESGKAYSFYRDQITGLSQARFSTRYLPAGKPILMQQRQVFGKKLDDAVILTASSAWEVTYRGAQDLGPDRLRSFQESTLHDIFYILRARFDEPGVGFEHHGPDVVENAAVETLQIFDADNRNVTVWIHSGTFLPVKQRFERFDDTLKRKREEIARFTKYRESGNGVMWPHDLQRERDGEKIFEMYADRINVGEELRADLFELPAGVKILKNK
jgi:hypothetical protein